jgi:hypothetical protein
MILVLVLKTVLVLFRRANAKTIFYKTIRGQLLRGKCNPKYLTFTNISTYFLKVYVHYGLNSCQYLNPELPAMRNLASRFSIFPNPSYLGTFVAATFFPGIKPIELYSPNTCRDILV